MELSAFQMLHGQVTNLHNDFKEHEGIDNDRFDKLTDALHEMNAQLQRYVGGVQMAAWSLAIFLPIITGAVISDVIRHWGNA